MQTLKLKPSKYADFMHAAKVRTPKYKFHLEVGGLEHKETIILIMGTGAQHLAWPREFCQTLIEHGFRVIRFDNRDIGKSSKIKQANALTKHYDNPLKKAMLVSRFTLGLSNEHLPLPYNLYDMAEDVHQLMNALDIDRSHFIGMSMGGMIAQILAANYPQRVDKLGLIATSNNRPLSAPPSLRRLSSLLREPKQQNSHEMQINHTIKTLKAVSTREHFDAHRARKKATMLHARRYYPKGKKRHILAILGTGSLTELNKKIQQPTLIIHGQKDKIVPPSHGKSIHKRITNSQFITIPNMGHEIPITLAPQIAEYFVQHFQTTNHQPNFATQSTLSYDKAHEI